MLPQRWRFLLCIALCCAIIFCCSKPLYAQSELDRKMQELQEIQREIDKYENLYKQKKKEENQVLGQIKNIENQIETLEREVGDLDSQIIVTKGEIAETEQFIDKTTERVEERSSYLNQRVKQIYMDGDIPYLEVLLGSSSITDFLTRCDMLEIIATNDAALLQELVQAKHELVCKKNELEIKAEKYNTLKNQKENKQKQYAIQSQQKEGLLNNIQQQKKEFKKTCDELEAVRKNVDAFIKSWQEQHQEVYMGSGKMAWPVPGRKRISSYFGPRIHPIHRVKSFHHGIDIPAPLGTACVAAERGKVIYVGKKTAYGNCIIVDHGGGISTQYSHLWKFCVTVGQAVNKGDVVGKIDSTGWSTGNHLDFIVRVKGTPQNPLNYVQPK